MTGPLGVENAILDRLAEVLDPATRVASGAAISALGLDLGALALPLVVVEPQAAQVSDLSARGSHVIEDQSWLVSLTARHTADPERLRSDYSEIDPVIMSIIGGLTGWKASTAVRELRYQGREDFIHEPGLIEVGLLFSTFYHLDAPQ